MHLCVCASQNCPKLWQIVIQLAHQKQQKLLSVLQAQDPEHVLIIHL